MEDLLPHEKAQSTADNQRRHRQQHHRIVRVGGEAARLGRSQQVKARITKGGHRGKNSLPDGLHAVSGQEAPGEDHRPHGLQHKGETEGIAHQPGHIVHIVEVEGGHHHQPLTQGHPLSHQAGQQKDHAHKPQAAQLDEQQNHNLSEQGKLGQGVHQDQARHTGGGCGGEQRRHQSAAFPGHRRDGQHQQQRPHQNHSSKRKGDDPGGVDHPSPPSSRTH